MSGIKRACVLGHPVAHSLSPCLHGHWLKKYNIHGDYSLLDTPPADLAETLSRLAGEGFAGCNLTLPLKEEALPLMDEVDESAAACGAVNTVVFNSGKKRGYNSDGFGFVESLKGAVPAFGRDHVVILGAGGAARGIAAALKKEGAVRFTILNRTRQKAEALVRDLRLPGIAAEWETRAAHLTDASLLINATSLGMRGQPPLDINISALPTAATVCDIVYRPRTTALLESALKRGHAVVEGLPMLLHQGRLGFKLWFGVDPAVTNDLLEEISACAA